MERKYKLNNHVKGFNTQGNDYIFFASLRENINK